jgi:2-polyprenyl-3-methyl-5-hydroxy-6-metoxy-1,4-benzoquinol methylase
MTSNVSMTSDFFVPADWYRTFFTEPVMRFWEAAVPAAATDAEVAFVVRHLGAHPPATILDVACGSGRHALALAQAGFTVTGVDLSEAALSRAQRLADSRGLAARFVCANMLTLHAEAPHDALICMGNSIGYFEPALTTQLLRKLAAAVRTGGRMIIDTAICAESLLPISPHRTFSFEGGTYDQEIVYDATQSIIKTRAQLTLGSERHELLYRHFVMTSGELVRSLRLAGFGSCALYADTEDGVFGLGSPRLLLVASRE